MKQVRAVFKDLNRTLTLPSFRRVKMLEAMETGTPTVRNGLDQSSPVDLNRLTRFHFN